MSKTPVLELRGVAKRFGDFEALSGVDLTVAPGQVYGFLGPNGAGKTTTLRMVTGLMRPSAGQVLVCGHDVVTEPRRAKRHIGFISDRPFLYDKLTGSEFLRFVGGIWGMQPDDIASQSAHWLERFDLAGWAGEPIDAYSHGMRQRILFCAALIQRPRLLIMDEPMVGLDPRGARQLKRIVRDLADQGDTSVLLSTHTLDVVEQVCDAVAIIDRGKLIANGTVQEIRAQNLGGSRDGDRLEDLFLRLTEDGQRGREKEPGEEEGASA